MTLGDAGARRSGGGHMEGLSGTELDGVGAVEQPPPGAVVTHGKRPESEDEQLGRARPVPRP